MILEFIKDFYGSVSQKIRSLETEGVDDIERREAERRKRDFKVNVSRYSSGIYVNGEIAGYFNIFEKVEFFIDTPAHIRKAVSQSEEVHNEILRRRAEAEDRRNMVRERQAKAWAIGQQEGRDR